MKIIKHRERTESVTYQRAFDYEDMPGAGYGFDCDEHGNVVDPTKPSYVACIAGTVNGKRVVDLGVRKFEHSYVEPAVGACECGAHVELYGFTNTCERCGRDYNSSGQLLGSREFWGEETGESFNDEGRYIHGSGEDL